MRDWYKIVDLIDGKVKTLFHGLNGSRVLPINQWLEAELKQVSDGPNGTPYLSGWHIMPTLEESIEYLSKFQNIECKAIVRCKVINVWAKAHSPSEVFLSRFLCIKEIAWTNCGVAQR